MEGGSDEKKVMRTFNLDGLPLEMKLKVLEKMSIKSLCKFRRTSKQNEEFVRKNRRLLRPEMNERRISIKEGTDGSTFTLEIASRPQFHWVDGPTWEDRWELLGNKNADTLNLDKVSSDSLRSEVIPFLEKLWVDGSPVDVLIYRVTRGIGTEDLDSIANVVNAETVRFSCGFRVPADSKLPFIQQWQTNHHCQLQGMHLSFFDESPPDLNGLVNWVENDGRFRKVWDRGMHGHSIVREVPLEKVLRQLRGIYVIERNFEVDNLGRNAVLLVFDDFIRFQPLFLEETVHDGLIITCQWMWYRTSG